MNEEIPVRDAIEGALYEIKRVIVGQDAMLERLLVALLAGGHVLLEGVPGLAKTLTVRTLADVLGGSFRRIQFTPDLVPADLVGTRIYRPDSGRFDTELGPVFGNFLLADEINRAPAKVQSALLEVMQERQVTIGGDTHRVPSPFLVLATQNPIESEGTYPLPEAQVDRFLLKLLVDYPDMGEEAAVVGRSLAPAPVIEERLSTEDLERFSAEAKRVFVERDVIGYAVQLADATRHPDRYGLGDLAKYIEYGSSPRGPIGLIAASQALAMLRGRRHVVAADVRDLAPDVLRHRLVLSYEALSDGVSPDHLLDRVLNAVDAESAGAGSVASSLREHREPAETVPAEAA
jgi:MoxR-like ATPase